jgi:capsular polysaccharide biosynthesis protein
MSKKLGIGITTYNRKDKLKKCIEKIKLNTGYDYDLVVADDGSTDDTISFLKEIGVNYVSGENKGIAWNKNRAMFSLLNFYKSDIIILIEDNCYPEENNWQNDWMIAAERFGHVNLFVDWIEQKFILYGEGTPQSPIKSLLTYNYCVVFTRESLCYVGYMDTRFKKYGEEHMEHTIRFLRAGYGGEYPGICFYLIRSRFFVSKEDSYFDEESLSENKKIHESISSEPIYRMPWRGDCELDSFRSEIKNAEERRLAFAIPSAPRGPQSTLHEVSAGFDEIESPTTFEMNSQISLNYGFSDDDVIKEFSKKQYTGMIKKFNLKNVYLDGSRTLFINDGKIIKDSAYLLLDEHFKSASNVIENAIAVPPDEEVIFGFNRGWQNYYHWLIQAVPAIDIAVRNKGSAPIRLALPPLGRFQMEILELLGLSRIPFVTIELDKNYHFESLIYMSNLNGSTAFEVTKSILPTFSRMSERVRKNNDIISNEIYISRLDSKNRVIANENELIDYLSDERVRIIEASSMSVAEQIATFRDAKLVIGGHGAGLSNIVFCKSKSTIYEILNSQYRNSCFNRLAQAKDLNYIADIFPGSASDNIHSSELFVDLAVVKDSLRRARKFNEK